MSGDGRGSAQHGMLTRQQVAERLGVDVRGLEVNVKSDPSFYRLNGRTIRYAEKDVEN